MCRSNVCPEVSVRERSVCIIYGSGERDTLWKLFLIYGIEGKLQEALWSFYQESKECVQVVGEEG